MYFYLTVVSYDEFSTVLKVVFVFVIHEIRLVITSHISYSNVSFYTVRNIQLMCSLCLQNLQIVITFSGTLCKIFSVYVTYTATSCCSGSFLFLGYNPRLAPLNFFYTINRCHIVERAFSLPK